MAPGRVRTPRPLLRDGRAPLRGRARPVGVDQRVRGGSPAARATVGTSPLRRVAPRAASGAEAVDGLVRRQVAAGRTGRPRTGLRGDPPLGHRVRGEPPTTLLGTSAP